MIHIFLDVGSTFEYKYVANKLMKYGTWKKETLCIQVTSSL